MLFTFCCVSEAERWTIQELWILFLNRRDIGYVILLRLKQKSNEPRRPSWLAIGLRLLQKFVVLQRTVKSADGRGRGWGGGGEDGDVHVYLCTRHLDALRSQAAGAYLPWPAICTSERESIVRATEAPVVAGWRGHSRVWGIYVGQNPDRTCICSQQLATPRAELSFGKLQAKDWMRYLRWAKPRVDRTCICSQLAIGLPRNWALKSYKRRTEWDIYFGKTQTVLNCICSQLAIGLPRNWALKSYKRRTE